MAITATKNREPLRRIYRNGNSAVVGIDPTIVKALNLDSETFCEETIQNGGIFLKIRRLTEDKDNEN